LRATVKRVLPLGGEIHVVTVAGQAAGCREELAGLGLGEAAVISEPDARGTGAAIGLAVSLILREDPDAIVCSVHADHHVGDDAAYQAAVWAAAGWAASTEGLAAVGLTPTRPHPGFGYVAMGDRRDPGAWRSPVGSPLTALDGVAAALPAYACAGYTEKPRLDVAEAYVRGGVHLWNLGLFAWPAQVFLAELAAVAPEVDQAVRRTVAALGRGDQAAAAEAYSGLRPVAVEPLILEQTSRLSVVHARFPWSDLGSWADLLETWRDAGAADAGGNVAVGDAVVVGSRDCLAYGRGGRLLAVVGAEGLVAVDVGDAVLVVPATEAQAVRDLVDLLRQQGRAQLL
jgi:mannose-1-phosphate guanylyltransferase